MILALVHKHMQKIIDNPDILIGASSSHFAASLNGDEWQNSNVVSKVLEIAQKLPYFKDLLVAFLLEQQILGSNSHLNLMKQLQRGETWHGYQPQLMKMKVLLSLFGSS